MFSFYSQKSYVSCLHIGLNTMPVRSGDEIDAYFEPENNSESKSSNWNTWYRGEAIDIRHESDGTGTIIGRGSDSHTAVNNDHLHYVDHEDGSRTVHRSDRTQG